MNESAFFFGNSDAFVTNPNRKRDRQLLCYSELHSRGLGYLDNNACTTEENVEHSKSCFDDEGSSASFMQLQSRAQLEDDTLLRLQAPQTFISPSLMLEHSRHHSWTAASTDLLQLRRIKGAADAHRAMHSFVVNCDLR